MRVPCLADDLHERTIWQDADVMAVMESVPRSLSGTRERAVPMRSLLGTSGGDRAKVVALHYDENNAVRTGTSKYMEAHSAARLIGSARHS